ncbi:MAG TPA: sulfate adenylyltransferase subunit CysN [Bryobacteraceae bacterium]|nr:sulfate adenylyltransferase subunit CysN [Bryobacteraceae bacterium]
MTSTTPVTVTDIESFLRQNEEKELLRFSTAGSVDDGKSTLIGRLLYDSKGVYEDQLASVRKVSVNQTSGPLDFALLTDGLRAEREQGITIDVAYRYFSTPKRKFIIADTPGHEQYTRNMATGASTANLAIILVDARHGVLPQSRRHAFIAALLGIQHMVVAVNKMDLVDFSEEVFENIRQEFDGFVAQFQVPDLHFIPISALHGDNVVEKSDRMPWFTGESLLHYLETVHIASDRNLTEMRFPVQYVIRPNLDFRGYGGQVASGVIRPGDTVMVLPSGRTTRVKAIATYDGNLSRAFPPMSVTVTLEDEIDISRGDMLVHPTHAPHVAKQLDARMVWMSHTPLDPGRPYLVKHTTQVVRAGVRAIRYKVNVNTLEKEPATRLELNEIGAVVIETHRPLFFDPYKRNRATGSFILIDPISNETVGAGMITGREPREAQLKSTLLDGLTFENSRVSPPERASRYGHHAATIWLEGNPELAFVVERKLFDRGCLVHVLADEKDAFILAELAKISNAAGMITICSVRPEDAAERERASRLVGADQFLEVDAASLSGNLDRAAEEICSLLEKRGVLAGEGDFAQGGGI